MYADNSNSSNNNIRYIIIYKLLAPPNIRFDAKLSRRAVKKNCSQKPNESD